MIRKKLLMHRVYKDVFVLFFLLAAFTGYGQEIPLGALPMQFNSSFAGEADAARVNASVGVRPPGRYFGWSYLSHASYDQFVPKLRSGVGFSVNHSAYSGTTNFVAYNGSYFGRSYGLSAAIAPKFSMKGKYTFSPSGELTYGSSRSFNQNLLGNGDDLDVTGSILKGRVGVLFNAQKWYIGYAVDIPISGSFRYRVGDSLAIVSNNRFVSYWQFGYTFQRSSESKFSFTPQLLFLTGADARSTFLSSRSWSFPFYRRFALLDIILNFRYKRVIWGLNGAGIHVGYQSSQMRIMLSQGIQSASGESYIGNLSFRYIFKQNDQTGRQRW